MKTIQITRGDHSVLILTPKPAFLEIVSTFAQKQSIGLNDIYFPEEDSVVLIPPLGTYGGYVESQAFIERLKPELLKREFGKFGMPAETDCTSNMFDHYFSITIRDRTEIASTTEI